MTYPYWHPKCPSFSVAFVLSDSSVLKGKSQRGGPFQGNRRVKWQGIASTNQSQVTVKPHLAKWITMRVQLLGKAELYFSSPKKKTVIHTKLCEGVNSMEQISLSHSTSMPAAFKVLLSVLQREILCEMVPVFTSCMLQSHFELCL